MNRLCTFLGHKMGDFGADDYCIRSGCDYFEDNRIPERPLNPPASPPDEPDKFDYAGFASRLNKEFDKRLR